MCQENPPANQARQGRYQFGLGTLALLVIACAVLLALYRGLGYEAAVLVGFLAAAWQVTRRWRRVPRLALLTVAASGAYFAAYYLSLQGKVYIFIGIDAASGMNRYVIEPNYLYRPIPGSPTDEDEDTLIRSYPDTFFGPALWVDRHVVRREYWRTVEKPLTGKKWRLTKLGLPEL